MVYMGLPINSMVIFHGYVSHNQMVFFFQESKFSQLSQFIEVLLVKWSAINSYQHNQLPMGFWWILVAMIANWLQVQRKVWAKAYQWIVLRWTHVAIWRNWAFFQHLIHFVIQIFTAMWTMRVADTSWHSQFWVLVWLEGCLLPHRKGWKGRVCALL